MDGAGLDKRLGLIGIEPLAGPQQDGRRQRRTLRRQPLPKQLVAVVSDGVDQPLGRPAAAPLDHRHGLGRFGPEPGTHPIGPQVVGIVELAGVLRPSEQRELTDHPQPIAGGHARQDAVDVQPRPARDGPPPVGVADRHQIEFQSGPLADGDDPHRIGRRRRNVAGRLPCDGLDAGRLGIEAGIETGIIRVEQTPSAVVPRRGRGGSSQEQRDRGRPVPTLPPQGEPDGQSAARHGPPRANGQGAKPVGHDPGTHGRQQNHQRLIRRRDGLWRRVPHSGHCCVWQAWKQAWRDCPDSHVGENGTCSEGVGRTPGRHSTAGLARRPPFGRRGLIGSARQWASGVRCAKQKGLRRTDVGPSAAQCRREDLNLHDLNGH